MIQYLIFADLHCHCRPWNIEWSSLVTQVTIFSSVQGVCICLCEYVCSVCPYVHACVCVVCVRVHVAFVFWLSFFF